MSDIKEFYQELSKVNQDVFVMALDDIAHDDNEHKIGQIERRIEKQNSQISRANKSIERLKNSQDGVVKVLEFLEKSDKIGQSLQLKMIKSVFLTRNEEFRKMLEKIDINELEDEKQRLLCIKEVIKLSSGISELIYNTIGTNDG